MQRECPNAAWGNSGYQVRSLDDPTVEGGFWCLTTVERPGDEFKVEERKEREGKRRQKKTK